MSIKAMKLPVACSARSLSPLRYAAGGVAGSPVVVACLQELDPVGEHLVYQPIGFVDAA